MIIEIPSGEDFRASSLALLNLAWTTAAVTLRAYRESEIIHPIQFEEEDPSAQYATKYTQEERRVAERRYWVQSQHSLGNALALTQQSVEMALRGRIADVSPYLLVVRDPRDLPKGSTKSDIPFSAFRSIDAADLVKIHNSFCNPATRLDAVFEKFWDALRRQRNIFIHSVRPATVEGDLLKAVFLIEQILLASRYLHPDKPWFEHRLDYLNSDEEIPEDATYAFLVKDFVEVIQEMAAKPMKDFFGLEKRRRFYSCPVCLNRCDTDYFDGDEWEKALCAQLHPPGRNAEVRAVRCGLCQTITPVVRSRCMNEHCEANVLATHDTPYREGQLMCLACHNPQDENDPRRVARWLPGAPRRTDLLERPLPHRVFPEDRQPEPKMEGDPD